MHETNNTFVPDGLSEIGKMKHIVNNKAMSILGNLTLAQSHETIRNVKEYIFKAEAACLELVEAVKKVGG